MTNETTASQPKSIGDDAQGEIRKVHHLKTDPEVFDAVARGVKTHEIRINDRDFQVGDRLVLAETKSTGSAMRSAPKLYPLEYTGRTESRIVSHIQTGYGLADGWCILSFHAPAAQASATIQAAPEYRVGWFWSSANPDKQVRCLAEGKEIADYEKRGDFIGWCDAATIQEPVMVAEPGLRHSAAARKHADRVDNMHKGVVDTFAAIKAYHEAAGNQSSVGSPIPMASKNMLIGAMAQYPAAPMVADPAGVALSKLCGKLLCLPQVNNGNGVYVSAIAMTGVISEFIDAATVKAVPSEALAEKEIDFVQRVLAGPGNKLNGEGESTDYSEGAEINALWKRPEQRNVVIVMGSYKWRVNPRLAKEVSDATRHIIANFVAPLADKTGGGE